MLEYDNNYIRRLIQLDLVGGLSPEEKGKLENWIDESEEHRLLFYKINIRVVITQIIGFMIKKPRRMVVMKKQELGIILMKIIF